MAAPLRSDKRIRFRPPCPPIQCQSVTLGTVSHPPLQYTLQSLFSFSFFLPRASVTHGWVSVGSLTEHAVSM